jgi:hypothetical protein
MPMRRLCIRWTISACFLLLFTLTAARCETAIELVTQSGAGGQIVYPQVTGLAEARISDEINGNIVKQGFINEHLQTLSSITSNDGWGIHVSAEYILHSSVDGNDILSVMLTAVGKMPNGRFGHVRTSMNFLLSTGRQLLAADVFTDVGATASYLDQYVTDYVEPNLSTYIENNSLVPVPLDNFYLDNAGIVFCYDRNTFSMLSGDSGAVELRYYELRDFLDPSPAGIPATIQINKWAETDGDTAGLIMSDAENGSLSGIPLQVGAPLQDAIDAYHLLSDPDFYMGGMMMELEDARLRGVQVMTDRQADDYSDLAIVGIQTGRANLYGIATGITEQQEWRKILGVPAASAAVDQGTAELYGITEGSGDLYRFGTHNLTLWSNQDGLLALIRLE